MVTPETGVKFKDVAGIDEAHNAARSTQQLLLALNSDLQAKEELMEIVDFLKASTEQ